MSRSEEMVSPAQSELQPPYLSGSDGGLRRFGIPTAWDNSEEDEKSIRSIAPKREYSLLTKCIAEFVGDFTFVFVGTMQTYVTQSKADNILHAAFAHGFTIFILVASLGHISGGHFNPAVSWAVAALRKMPFYHLPCYMVAQLLGGFCGSLMSAAILTTTELDATYAGATLLSPNNQWWEGLISETVVTYFLVHTILLTAVDTDKNVLAPLAIGLTLTIDIISTGKITGASMNPARSLGPNIVGQIFVKNLPPNFWNYHYIYWAGPFLGATIAAGLFKLFESREERIVR